VTMRRPLTPVWLAAPSRFANISQPAARAVVAVLALFLAAATLAALSAVPGHTDTALYGGIVEGVRHGGNYYAVTADALRAGGYPLAPFTAFRLPTSAVIEAALPGMAVMAMLYLLTGAAAAAWYGRMRSGIRTRGARTMVAVLLFASLAPMLQTSFAPLPELWAGLAITLSLAVRRREHFFDAIALGLAAAVLSETAALYLMTMLVFALAERERRESLGWALALIVVVAVLSVHAHAVAEVVKPLDGTGVGWTGALSLSGFVSAAVSLTALGWLPLWLAAPIIGIATFGWATWRDPVAPRALVTIALTALLIAVVGREDTPHWALLVTPILLTGLVFVPDGLRDLVRAALDSRRITVRRIIR
jgi:hypothetical protein